MINYVWKDSEKIDMDRTIFVSTANHAIPAWEKKKQHPYPPLGNPGAKKKHRSWNIPWSWGATGKQSQDADGVVLENEKKRLLGERIVNT